MNLNTPFGTTTPFFPPINDVFHNPVIHGYQINPLPLPPPPPLPLPLLLAIPPPAPVDPANPPPLTARQQYALNHRQVLATLRGRRIHSPYSSLTLNILVYHSQKIHSCTLYSFMWTSVGMVVITVILVLLSTVAPWFHLKGQHTTYYCKDSFLWVFVLPPLFCIPLLFSSTPHVRLCWWHCWTVTVISIDVPAAVVFVSFGASLVYTGTGVVMWDAGAFFVLLAYITCILAGLLFMKLAHIIEVGVPHPVRDAPPPPGPITVCIKADSSDKYAFDDDDFRQSPTPGRALA